MKYIHYFTAVTDYNTVRSENYEEPWVSLTEESEISDIDYNKTEEEKLREMPLTFEITSNGNIVWSKTSNANTKTIEYSKNGGEWTSITSYTGTSAPSISVVNGDIIQFRGNNNEYASTSSNYNTFSGTTSNFKLKGNVMSLINSTNFANLTSFPNNSEYNFTKLFISCTGLTDASELILPATTLTNYCYSSMFYGCTSLTTAPELPATTLAQSCYNEMFHSCTSLVNVPVLPATTLAESCYAFMFVGASLVSAPELPATTLTNNCYMSMFSNCTSLNYIKCLATDISASNCTLGWVNGVASTGQFVTPSRTIWATGTTGIPANWTRINVDGSPYSPPNLDVD